MIKLRAIAECAIDLEKGRIEASSEIHFGILAHLIVERGKPVARATLVDAFWWNADDADGRHCLRQAIYKLRQMGVPIEGDGDTFTLGERAALADFDCADERTLALSPLPPEQAVAIFPGYAPRASAPFLTWLERTRERAGRAVRGVLVRALGEARRRNGWEEAAKLARQCLVLDPLNEEATLTLAEYTALQGDKHEALRLIDSYMEEIGGTYGDLRIPASLLRNRISERVAYPPASAAGKIPLVGREDSLRVLAGVATEVAGGAGHTFVIHGAPGIGKTRLITEFANISAMKGARIVRVECHADAAERALSVFMELAPQLLRMPGALGCSPEALRLVRRLGRHDPNERLDADEYGGPASLHAAVRASLRDLIDAIAAERPLYLMIEDVHWIDPISLEVLKEIIGSNRGRALLVLMTTRTLGDGELLRGVDRRQLIVHELEPLGEAASRRLAETLCGALAIQTEGKLIDWCIQRGAGNPLFMTELLAHWRETKDMERVPVSLEALIDERLAALSEGALRTLQTIALLEGEATYELLEAVLGMPRWKAMGCVEELEKAGVVTSQGVMLRTLHDVISRAAARCLSTTTSSYLHRAIAGQLQRTAEFESDPALVWRAASHWTAAGAPDTALNLLSEAARHLANVGSHYGAARLIEQAAALTNDPDQKLALFHRRCDYLESCGPGEALITAASEALALESCSRKRGSS
ncbi:MAG TPA: AAA family ATPase, partial [Gemmatimonadaceae bacterium]